MTIFFLGMSEVNAVPPFLAPGAAPLTTEQNKLASNTEFTTFSSPQGGLLIHPPNTYYPSAIPASTFQQPIQSITTTTPLITSHGPLVVYIEVPASAGSPPQYIPYILKSNGADTFSLTVS